MMSYYVRYFLAVILLAVVSLNIFMWLTRSHHNVPNIRAFFGEVNHTNIAQILQKRKLFMNKTQMINSTRLNQYANLSSLHTSNFTQLTTDITLARKDILHQYDVKRKFTALSFPARAINESNGDYFLKSTSVEGVRLIGLYISSFHQKNSIRTLDDIELVRWERDRIFPFYVDRSMCSRIMLTPQREDRQSYCEHHSQLHRVGTPEIHVSAGDFSRHFSYYSRVSIHIITDGVVQRDGHVQTRGVQFIPSMCTHHTYTIRRQIARYSRYKLFDEVLTIAQWWGQAYFPFQIEALPRIIPYIQFLKDNPSIKIHVPAAALSRIGRHFEMLGLDSSRLVMGNIRSRVVYLPQGGECGVNTNPLLIQQLSNIYLSYMDTHYQPITKRAVVLIQRTKSRQLRQHAEIQNFLWQKAKEAGFDFVIFSDLHLPSFEDTQQLFRRATLVVGPHGAGLSNLMWTPPPAVVVEVLCAEMEPVVCYPYLSQNLGHRHFGIKATRGCEGGMDVDMTNVKRIVEFAMMA